MVVWVLLVSPSQPLILQGVLTICTWENQKFWLDNQMIPVIPFKTLQKIWSMN